MRINISEKKKFVLRVAGIFMRGNSVLFHRADHEDIWALPGGGCEFFEDSKVALVREAKEELDASIHIKSLAFIVENFFNWEGLMTHEIGLYYYADFTENSVKLYDQDEFEGIEEKMEGYDKFRLHFKWFPLQDLPRVNIKPDFLIEQLQKITKESRHVIHLE